MEVSYQVRTHQKCMSDKLLFPIRFCCMWHRNQDKQNKKNHFQVRNLQCRLYIPFHSNIIGNDFHNHHNDLHSETWKLNNSNNVHSFLVCMFHSYYGNLRKCVHLIHENHHQHTECIIHDCRNTKDNVLCILRTSDHPNPNHILSHTLCRCLCPQNNCCSVYGIFCSHRHRPLHNHICRRDRFILVHIVHNWFHIADMNHRHSGPVHNPLHRLRIWSDQWDIRCSWKDTLRTFPKSPSPFRVRIVCRQCNSQRSPNKTVHTNDTVCRLFFRIYFHKFYIPECSYYTGYNCWDKIHIFPESPKHNHHRFCIRYKQYNY